MRFIPAGAGNGADCSLCSVLATVHPRGCGERYLTMALYIHPSGSSPRVRGTEAVKTMMAHGMRFIPAGAGNGRFQQLQQGGDTVHPRGCGERRVRRLSVCVVVGSSPRVRGTAVGLPSGLSIVRFIPAGAGNGCTGRRCTNPTPVHPRGCGERDYRLPSAAVCVGSSPRVRGTEQQHLEQRQNRRFIPAGAGNGLWCCMGCNTCPVHPRGCGERPR